MGISYSGWHRTSAALQVLAVVLWWIGNGTASPNVSRREAVITVIDSNASSSRHNQSNHVIHFVCADAPLLSGQSLDQCVEAQDPDCSGGMAAVSAYIRHQTPDGESSLVIPKLQKDSQFVMIHPLAWNINRVVLQGLMKWNVFLSTPSLLLQDKNDNPSSNQDLSYLQSPTFPLLISNVDIPPSNSWNSGGHHKHIHFDFSTGVALMVFSGSGQPLNFPSVDTVRGLLNVIRRENDKVGAHCTALQQGDQHKDTMIQRYEEVYAHGNIQLLNLAQDPTNIDTAQQKHKCWIPVVLWYDTDADLFQQFLNQLLAMPYTPAILLDAGLNAPQYQTPTRIDTKSPRPGHLWIHSYFLEANDYFHHKININATHEPPTVQNVTVITNDLEDLPQEYKDQTYAYQISLLRQFADEAIANDPVVGQSTYMPPQREESLIFCNVGECEIGNLFTNAMLWFTGADVAFTASGGLRGPGWKAGPVHLSNIWASLPFPNTICQGVMSGISLFKMLDYSIRLAKFDTTHDNDADRLLQVAGLKIVYNPTIPQGESRLVSVQVWNKEMDQWTPLDPTALYKFATDSYLCRSLDPYPTLTGYDGSFRIDFEQGGQIGDDLVQDVVQDYMKNLTSPYNTSLEGRLSAEPDATATLDLIQTAASCLEAQYFSSKQVCLPCPNLSQVAFSETVVEFKYQQGRALADYSKGRNGTATGLDDADLENMKLLDRIILVNRALFNVTIFPQHIPPWLGVTTEDEFVVFSQGRSTPLKMGASLALILTVDPTGVLASEQFNVIGTVAVGVIPDGDSLLHDPAIDKCDEFALDLTFDVALTVLPPSDLNNLGNIRFFGLSLMAVVMISAIGFALFAFKYRETRVLKFMQPVFLIGICCGDFVMSSTILPMSFDDQVLTPSQCNHVCAAIPWLFSTGFIVVFSIIFSKLWRINRLFHGQRFQRVALTEKDVLGPFIIAFSINLALLISWTLVDPLQWKRIPVKGEEWKTYGACQAAGIGYIFMGVICALLLGMLLLACYQAYKARDISDEFSESKNLGFALFTWLQVLVVGVPSIFLVAEENFTARYFIMMALIFVLCESMLLLIFVPLVQAMIEFKKHPNSGGDRRGSTVTGLNTGGGRRGSTMTGYNGGERRRTTVTGLNEDTGM